MLRIRVSMLLLSHLSSFTDSFDRYNRLKVLELQHTLADLSARVESVKEENMNLRSENQILGQYIEKLMISSPVFHSSSPPTMERNKRTNQMSTTAAAATVAPSSGLGLQTFPFEENSGMVSEEEFP
ncbi:hypothetical protein SprV_0100065100 [Sparganum proliferum]